MLLQSHASYSRCGLGSHGTDRIVALVRDEAAAAAARGERPALYGAKITGGGSGGLSLCLYLTCHHLIAAVPALSGSKNLLVVFVSPHEDSVGVPL